MKAHEMNAMSTSPQKTRSLLGAALVFTWVLIAAGAVKSAFAADFEQPPAVQSSTAQAKTAVQNFLDIQKLLATAVAQYQSDVLTGKSDAVIAADEQKIAYYKTLVQAYGAALQTAKAGVQSSAATAKAAAEPAAAAAIGVAQKVMAGNYCDCPVCPTK